MVTFVLNHPMRCALGVFAPLLSLIGLLVVPASAAIENRTIDDTFGDSLTGQRPNFQPSLNTPGVWEGPTCVPCTIRPDAQMAFQNTFTAATNKLATSGGVVSIDMDFEGSAIWVYFILADIIGNDIISSTVVNFTIDDGPPTPFQHISDPANSNILYDQMVFSQTNLANANHALRISTSPSSITWVNFDYAVYQHDGDALLDLSTSQSGLTVSRPTTSSAPATSKGGVTMQTPVASIVGGVVGGVVGIALLSVLLMCCVRRRRTSREKYEDWTGEGTAIPDAVLNPFSSSNPAQSINQGSTINSAQLGSQSDWTLGSSNDPPPGYTPGSSHLAPQRKRALVLA